MSNNDAQGVVILFLIVIVIAIFAPRRWKPSRTAFGTGRWATELDLKRARMLSGGNGLIVGRASNGRLIRLPKSAVHVSIFAPTGAGKNVSFVIPWLLTYIGSLVVTDPKGENYRLTAARRRAMGAKVWRLDPFEVCGPGADSWNVLDLIGSGPECIDEARALAEAMVIRPPEGERDPHWSDQAANVLTALLVLLLVQCKEGHRTLSGLRELLTDPEGLDCATTILREKGGVFARLGGLLAQLEDKERAGVLSTANRHATFLDSPAILAATSTSSFDARELLTGNVTLYLILPPHQAEAQARWTRLVVCALIRMVGREAKQEN